MDARIQAMVDMLSGKSPTKKKKYIPDEEYQKMKKPESKPSKFKKKEDDGKTDQERMDEQELMDEYSDKPEASNDEGSPEEEDSESPEVETKEDEEEIDKPKRTPGLFGKGGSKGMAIMMLKKRGK